MIDMQAIVMQIDSLTPVPRVVTQVMELADDPDSSLADVAEVIKYDPLITANLLKICNSAYFGLPRVINSIHDATTLLGLDQIVEMFIFKCAFENLHAPQEGYELKEYELLRQSAASALISKLIAEQLETRTKHLVFTAALLKDIGKIVLARYVAQAYERIRQLVETEGFSFLAAEKRILGTDHAEVGGLIAGQWGFSPQMAHIIRNHHLVDSASEADQATAIVYVSDHICMLLGLCVGTDGLAYPFYDEILARLQMTEDTIKRVMVAYLDNRPKVEALLDAS
jgi:HD-like signal output (HDOD) protein